MRERDREREKKRERRRGIESDLHFAGMVTDELHRIKNAADLILSQRINLMSLYEKRKERTVRLSRQLAKPLGFNNNDSDAATPADISFLLLCPTAEVLIVSQNGQVSFYECNSKCSGLPPQIMDADVLPCTAGEIF